MNISLTWIKTCSGPRYFLTNWDIQNKTDYNMFLGRHILEKYKMISRIKKFYCNILSKIVIITICLKVKNWENIRQIDNVRSATLYKCVNGIWYTLIAICKSRRIQKYYNVSDTSSTTWCSKIYKLWTPNHT